MKDKSKKTLIYSALFILSIVSEPFRLSASRFVMGSANTVPVGKSVRRAPAAFNHSEISLNIARVFLNLCKHRSPFAPADGQAYATFCQSPSALVCPQGMDGDG